MLHWLPQYPNIRPYSWKITNKTNKQTTLTFTTNSFAKNDNNCKTSPWINALRNGLCPTISNVARVNGCTHPSKRQTCRIGNTSKMDRPNTSKLHHPATTITQFDTIAYNNPKQTNHSTNRCIRLGSRRNHPTRRCKQQPTANRLLLTKLQQLRT